MFLLKERDGKLLEVLKDLICSDIRPVTQYEYIHVKNADESPEGRDILPDPDDPALGMCRSGGALRDPALGLHR